LIFNCLAAFVSIQPYETNITSTSEREECIPVQLEIKAAMHYKVEPTEYTTNSFACSDADLFSSIPSSDDILDELLDMQGDFSSQQTVSESVEVMEDPLDPFSSVWEQPFSSAGIEFNFDSLIDNH